MSSSNGPIDYQSRLKEALLALQKMRSRIEELEKGAREPIAVIGLGCRFPGQANDAESYWRLLQNGVDAIREVPEDRWDVEAHYDPDPKTPGKMFTREGGFIDDVGHFDPHFFGISPREARSLDPQQRVLLEVAWEALENAGQSPDTLYESQTGVFVGVTMSDYLQLQANFNAPDRIGPYRITGNMLSSIAGRVSYTLGLRGPAMAVDTACSSSLIAIYLAVQSLLTGDSDMVLAGGVNLLLSPEVTVSACKANMLSLDGRCKTFDSGANGFIRSEGCGVIVLKRLSDARKSGDRILAVIRGAASNHDGFSSGFTVPSKLAQEAVIKNALAKAGVSADMVGYVETHGTGTSLGDPIEVRALSAAYGANRAGKPPLWLGAVKTNIGHLEAASGVAGLIKVVLSLVHRQIPANLHLKELNPFMDWKTAPFRFPNQITPWEPINGRWLAGVSSFGASGMNAHIILEAAPEADPAIETAPWGKQILCLSAKTETALQELAARYNRFLDEKPSLSIADICYTANRGRAHFGHRLAVMGEDSTQIRSALAAFGNGKQIPNLHTGTMQDKGAPKIAFLFTGHGSQYINMGRGLYETNPVFRQAFDEVERLLSQYLEQPLKSVVFSDTGEASAHFSGMKYTQAALFALEYSLARMWISWGIEPAAVVGHSVGEYAAACIAGAISLADAVKMVAARGRLMDELPETGAMAVVFADEEAVSKAIQADLEEVSIAVINSPDNIVISGESQVIERIREELRQAGLKSRLLDVAQASHSPLIDPILEEFGAIVDQVEFSDPSIDYVSCLTGELIEDGETLRQGYWRRHLRQTVRFAQAIERLDTLGCDVYLEIGPNPVLLSIGKRNLPGETGVFLPSLRKERDDWEQVLSALSALYAQGARVAWDRFYQGQTRRLIELPTYPFQRQHYWIETGPTRRNEGSGGPALHPLLGNRLQTAAKEIIYENQLALEDLPFLADHVVDDRAILPGTGFLELAVAAATDIFGKDKQFALEDILLQEPLVLVSSPGITLQTLATPLKDNRLEIKVFSLDQVNKSWTLHMSGKARLYSEGEPKTITALSELQAGIPDEIPVNAYYQSLNERGLAFGPGFRGIERLWLKEGEALGKVKAPSSLIEGLGGFHFHPALLDSGLQPYAALLPENGSAYLPFNIAGIKIYGGLPQEFWSHVRLNTPGGQNSGTLTANLRLYDDMGRLLLEIEKLTILRAGRGPASIEKLKNWLYEVTWQPMAVDDTDLTSLATPEQIAESLQDDLERISSAPDNIKYHQLVTPHLTQICAIYIQNAFIQLGWKYNPGQRFSTEELAEQLNVASQHSRLLGRLAEILAEVGTLVKEDGGWFAHQALHLVDPSGQVDSLLDDFPSARQEIVMTQRFGENLAQGLLGKQNPLELLFPGGSLDDAEALYRDAPFTRSFNQLAAAAVSAAVEPIRGQRPIRILEIGAGTGGTTEHVLAALRETPVEYTFTDISPLFLNATRRKFANRSDLVYRKLDIEIDPQDQGFDLGAYDLVLAANVLHATRSLRHTLKRVKSLLTPEGNLILLEGIQKQAFIDLIVGLTDGWWSFTDLDLRPAYPLMQASQWLSLFDETGFTSAVSITGKNVLCNQAVLVAKASGAAAPDIGADASGDWLIFADQAGLGSEIKETLKNSGGDVVMVQPGSLYQASSASEFALNPTSPDDFQRLLDDNSKRDFRGVIYLWALDAPELIENRVAPGSIQENISGSALFITQALARTRKQLADGLWLVTRGVHRIQPAGDLFSPSPAPATLWGLGKVIVQEHPELSCVCLDLEPGGSRQEAGLLVKAIRTHAAEDQIALRAGSYYAPRLAKYTPEQPVETEPFMNDRPYELTITERGALDNLKFQPLSRRLPGAGEVEIQVYTSGLAFRDVLNALGMYPGGGGLLGSECAGVVSAVGPGVTEVETGDEVIAVARGSFASHVITPVNYVYPKPDYLSFTEAATLPSAYFTAAYVLKRLAKVKAGDRILIHAAAGGVGLAAVQLAIQAGAKVFATAGAPEKRELVRSYGVQHVMDSRSLDFAEEVMALTGGQGVDIVLNSLADEFISKSVQVLAPKGCFLEIGKRGIWSAERFAQERPEATYHVIDLLEEFTKDSQFIRTMFEELLPAFEKGLLKPLPLRVFPISETVEAFRFMAQARHTGKIIVEHMRATRRAYIKPDATYLITGGMGGLGLEVARWLVLQGARNLAMIGRRRPSAEAKAVLDELAQAGANIQVLEGDVSKPEDVNRVVDEIRAAMPPLKGAFDAAGQLDDGILVQQTWSRFTKVFGPKLHGSWNLYQATRRLPLDFFVLFSSANTLMGSPGQGNHVAACTFQDAFGHYMKAQGSPVLCIGWGPWAMVGAAAVSKVGEHTMKRGVGYIYPEQGIQVLEYLMEQAFSTNGDRPTHVVVVPINNPARVAEQFPDGKAPPFFSELFKDTLEPDLSAEIVAETPQSSDDLMSRLTGAPPTKRQNIMLGHVQSQVIKVLGLDPSFMLNRNQPLQELGLDSLMAVELRNLLAAGLRMDHPLPATLVFDYTTADALAGYLMNEIFPAGGEVGDQAISDPAPGQDVLDELQNLTDEEAEDQLISELNLLHEKD
jgi:acyl transferase domain-containing protein/NADPH:quinone reductase-like Zn-dependent oxidoreductase/ubiquinone/menaquinone biosynthesis C-methylase UbiE